MTDLKVTFFPPLHQQRRVWVLDFLRRERITEIVDIGCGEGELLGALCQPAPWLNSRACWKHGQDNADDLSPLLDDVLLSDSETPDLHPTRIAGLDISIGVLQHAAELTSPASANTLYTRWESLEVNLWQGSLLSINSAFIDAECIVATEVIEHLTDDLAAQFAPVLLGVYHPRVLLMTTPSYTFNARFSPPGVVKPGGYPDPTGRTQRVFRHPDHKFEWTTEEFMSWCTSVSKEWGYTVEVGCIGTPLEQDPWGRNEELGGASQVAAFRRLDDPSSRNSRELRRRTVCSAVAKEPPHRLFITHRFLAHPQAGSPSSLEEISAALTRVFMEWGEAVLRVEDLWFSKDIAVLCGGSMEVLIRVVESDSRLCLQRIARQRKGNWTVEFLEKVQWQRNEWRSAQKRISQETQVMVEDTDTEEDDLHSYPYSFDSGICISSDQANHWAHEADGRWTQDEEGMGDWGCSWAK